MTYLPPDLDVDRDSILQTMIDEASEIGLVIREGTELWLFLLVVAARHADELELLSERAEGEFDDFGKTMLREPRRVPVGATTTISVVADDTTGHSLDAGTGFTFAGDGSDRVAFSLVSDLTILPGDTTATVDARATVQGAAGNGWSADPQLDVAVTWIASISTVIASHDGSEGETDDEYLDRLSALLQLLGITLTTARKFALAAQLVDGVDSALELDLYDADTDDDDAEGHITVAVRGPGLDVVSGGVKTTTEAFLEDNALSVVHIHVIDPTFTDVDVNFVGVAEPGRDPDVVEADAITAVELFFELWGRPRPISTASGGSVRWVDQPIVRFQDVSAILNNVGGLDHWTTLTLNGGTADVTLDGPAGLPSPGSSVTGSVS